MSLAVVSNSTSPDSMESACSFSCSPSPPPAERRQEETRDEECDSLNDNHMPSKALTQCCSHITLTVGDAPKAMLIKSLRRESVDELFISESESSCFLWIDCFFSLNMPYISSVLNVSELDAVEDVLTCALPGNLVDPAERHMLEITQIGILTLLKASC